MCKVAWSWQWEGLKLGIPSPCSENTSVYSVSRSQIFSQEQKPEQCSLAWERRELPQRSQCLQQSVALIEATQNVLYKLN